MESATTQTQGGGNDRGAAAGSGGGGDEGMTGTGPAAPPRVLDVISAEYEALLSDPNKRMGTCLLRHRDMIYR